MNNKGRIENSIRNISFSLILQLISVLLRFIVRSVFIHYLNAEYLGINGLFSNILTMLSIAELGVGSAIVYNMYKPIAEKNEKQIAKLMSLYKIAYRIIGIMVLSIGLSLTPFLQYIIKGKTSLANLNLIYVMFVLDSGLSYFYSYKRSLLSADQNEYILQIFKVLFDLIRSFFQIFILMITSNFLLYLVVQIICTFLENFCISKYVDKKYKFLNKYKTERLTKNEKKPIFEDVGALVIYKIGSRILDGTDNIIISSFVGVVPIGILSNYTLINGSISMITSKIVNALTASVGNFIAKEDSQYYEILLKRIVFFNFIMYGFVFIMSYTLFNPFIELWLGQEYVFTKKIVFIIALNEYILGMMNAIWTFRSTMGLFVYGKWRPLVSAVINVVISIILAKICGLMGVLLGTTITRLITNVWYDPMIVYKFGIRKKPYDYYMVWLKYFLIVLFDIVILEVFSTLINISGLLQIIILACFATFVFSVTILAFFYKTDELKYLLNILKQMMKSFKRVIKNR